MLPQDAADNSTVFICYAHEDNDSTDQSKRWLNRLLQHLQPLVFQKQVRPWSDTSIETGERWHESIKAQLQKAQVAVLLISPAFLASEYIRNSELPVLLMNAQNSGVTVLPVILRRCLLTATTFKYPDPVHGPEELSLSTFQAVNSPDKPLNAMLEHEQDEVFVSIALRILKIVQPKPTGSLASGTAMTSQGGMTNYTLSILDIPHSRNIFFTGRGQVLDHLHRTLIARGKAALNGMGGVGKTQTAIEYAYRHRKEYEAVLWAKADTEETLKADYATIAVKLNLPEKDETDKDVVVTAVKRWLEKHTGWLLILDNADNLMLVSELLRREWHGHILLTTRAHATGGISKVEIREMTLEEGTFLLLRRAKLIEIDDALESATEVDRALAAEITREVGGLPLALDQVGAFIEEMSSSLAEYLVLYRREGAKLRAARGDKIADHKPVTITFSLAFQQVSSVNAAAADLLRVCALVAPYAIPEEIFAIGAGELGEHISAMAGEDLNLVKMIGEAGRFSLIRRSAKSGTIEMHRLVQQVLKDEMGAENQRLWAERVVRALNESFPVVEHKNWPLCEKLLPHAQEAARLIGEYGFEFIEAARLLNEAGYYCNDRAQYGEAERLLVWSLNIREKALGPEHPDVATSLNNLAYLYNIQGKYAEAEPLYVRALSIREKALGPEHPDVVTSLNNLAYLYGNQGKYAEAEPLYVRALGICEKVLGPDHPDMAGSLNNLAILYNSQGKYAEAEPLCARALGIYEKALGPEHPYVASSLNNLAHLYNIQGKYAEAEPLYVRALSIREKALGPEHPDVATSLNNLAYFYNSQGKYAEAEPLYVRALGIYEKVLGPDHPRSSVIRKNYTALLQKMRHETEE